MTTLKFTLETMLSEKSENRASVRGSVAEFIIFITCTTTIGTIGGILYAVILGVRVI